MNFRYGVSVSHPALTWQWVQNSWGQLASILSQRQIAGLVVEVTRHLRDDQQLIEARIFLNARAVNLEAVEKVVAQAKRATKWVDMYSAVATSAFNTIQ